MSTRADGRPDLPRRGSGQRRAMPLPPPPPPGEGRAQPGDEGRGQRSGDGRAQRGAEGRAQRGDEGRREGRGEPSGAGSTRAAQQVAEPARTVPSQTHRLRRALSSRRALRQAILLREVLGPPVGLRRPGDGPADAR